MPLYGMVAPEWLQGDLSFNKIVFKAILGFYIKISPILD